MAPYSQELRDAEEGLGRVVQAPQAPQQQLDSAKTAPTTLTTTHPPPITAGMVDAVSLGDDFDIFEEDNGNDSPSNFDADNHMGLRHKGARAVRHSKRILYAVVLFGALTMAVLTWVLIRREERRTFETEFRRYATAVIQGSNASVLTIFDQLETLATSITSHTRFQQDERSLSAFDHSSNEFHSSMPPQQPATPKQQQQQQQLWYSLPHFDTRTAELQSLAGTEFMVWAPLVRPTQIPTWETYVQQQWKDIERDTFSNTPSSVDGAEPPSPVVYAVPPVFQQQDDRNDTSTTATSTSSQEGGHHDRSWVVPILQYGPLRHRSNTALVNLDLYSHAVLRRAIDTVVQTRHSVLVDVDDVSFLLPTGITNPLLEKEAAAAARSNRRRSQRSVIVEPVRNGFADHDEPHHHHQEEEVVVGVILAVEPWSSYLERHLPEGLDGFVVDLRSTSCRGGGGAPDNDDDFDDRRDRTFRVNGKTVEFVGTGDSHDTAYDAFAQTAPFATAFSAAASNVLSKRQRLLLQQRQPTKDLSTKEKNDDTTTTGDNDTSSTSALLSCEYSITVYPSRTFAEGYYTAEPYWYAALVLVIFLVTVLVFAVYDWHVRRRDRTILAKARDTASLVQALFPKDVGERVMHHKEQIRRAEERERTDAERWEAARAAYGPSGFLHGVSSPTAENLVPEDFAPVVFATRTTTATTATTCTRAAHNSTKKTAANPAQQKEKPASTSTDTPPLLQRPPPPPQQQQKQQGRGKKKTTPSKEDQAAVFHHVVYGNFPLSLVADTIAAHASQHHQTGGSGPPATKSNNRTKNGKHQQDPQSRKMVVVKEHRISPKAPRGTTVVDPKNSQKKKSTEKGEAAAAASAGASSSSSASPSTKKTIATAAATTEDAAAATPQPSKKTLPPPPLKRQTSAVTDHDATKKADPIADYYPETTIMFADIVGFASWSAVCEPKTILLLLETLFGEFDKRAKRRRVYKIETVGDCYVAVAGVPEPHPQHFMAMARFAMDCMLSFSAVLQQLEPMLGPDIRELALRVGLHSGPVTGGILRSDRARFQLFGDTMNTASRMESTGCADKIHISQETAELLRSAGKAHWLRPREERIFAKGKGKLQTYWIVASFAVARGGGGRDTTTTGSMSSSSNHDAMSHHNPQEEDLDVSQHILVQEVRRSKSSKKKISSSDAQLATWNVDILGGLLQQVVVGRRRARVLPDLEEQLQTMESAMLHQTSTPFEELEETIAFPPNYTTSEQNEGSEEDGNKKSDLPGEEQLDATVAEQLEEFIHAILSLYHDNKYENFEHASRMSMSLVRLFSLMIPPKDHSMPDHTLGLGRHAYAQFCMGLAAIVKGVDHAGLSNAQLVRAQTAESVHYGHQSVAEQHSFDMAWQLLMRSEFTDLRRAIYTNETEFRFFRRMMIHAILGTDLLDPVLSAERTAQWMEAFGPFAPAVADQTSAIRDFKRTMVVESLMQAGDIFHTMQHWQIYVKWSRRKFRDYYAAFQQEQQRDENERGEKEDPAGLWCEKEHHFFEFGVMPLVSRLQESGIWGEVSGREFLHHAGRNQLEWRQKGPRLVQQWKQELQPVDKNNNNNDDDFAS